jgi:ABC-type phosphate transport system substrate-binding protein
MVRAPSTWLSWLCRLSLLAALAILPCVRVSAEAAPGFRVIVNAQNQVTSVDRRFLADAFLKKTTRWGDGQPIRPVDLGPDAAVRQRFSDDVLRRSVSAVKSYWQQLVFSGRDVPPPELDSDEEVVRYVARYPGAVGYVSPAASLAGVRAVMVR